MGSQVRRRGVLTFGDVSASMPDEYVLRAPALCHELNRRCTHCNAWTWFEESLNCCSGGKYVVEPLVPLPAHIEDLFKTKHFQQNQRRYNGLFSFTAMGAAPSPTWTQPNPPSCLVLHGRSYHRITRVHKKRFENLLCKHCTPHCMPTTHGLKHTSQFS